MTFMRKLLDALNMDNLKSEDNIQNTTGANKKEQVLSLLQSKLDSVNILIDKAKNTDDKAQFDNYINEIKLLLSEFSESKDSKEPVGEIKESKTDSAYDKYYENLRKQRENNLNISYEDVKSYDMKPFNLKATLISDEVFTVIELSKGNLDIAYKCLYEINNLLSPHKHLYEYVVFPKKINTAYEIGRKLPESHLRFLPYTATKRKSKYPLCLWLSSSNNYGTEYIYAIYFDRDGNIGQCELSLHGSDGIGISYETKVRRNESGLYILRISKTLYSPPYGTTTIYHCRDSENIPMKTVAKSNPMPETKYMSDYEIEQYAKECNAYVMREDRKEQQ